MIKTDNELIYEDLIRAVITYSDPEATHQIFTLGEKKNVTITPSTQDFRQDIINNILGIHQVLKIKITFSKSLQLQKNISYSVFENSEK